MIVRFIFQFTGVNVSVLGEKVIPAEVAPPVLAESNAHVITMVVIPVEGRDRSDTSHVTGMFSLKDNDDVNTIDDEIAAI